MLLNEGEYKGKRILSKDYIKEATSFKISTNNWGWGDYGYQFWLVPEGEGFRADGAFGQLTCVFPKYNVIISTQRKDNTDPFPVLDLLRKCIFTKFH